MRLHEVPKTIVLDRDMRFVSTFWRSLQKAIGIRLAFNRAYHSQSDGQTEMTNQIIEDMMRTCSLDHQVNWK